MSIRIPTANINNVISRNVVKQMASDGFLPVIALEAFVEAGRTYQAYQRGGFDEARERITEEFSGAIFWLGGVTALNALFEKLGQKLLKLPNINVSIAKDDVHNPLANFLEHERTKDGAKILEKTMARFKFAKVISSVLIANAFIGFILPKVNQAITRSYHKNKKNENGDIVQLTNPSFTQKPSLDNFAQPNDNKKDKKDISFGLNLLTLANKFESDRNYKLLAVDAGTASGRAYSARNNDERVEILFRDLSSIYFYMFNMQNMNNWLNRIEQGSPTRIDPVSAEFATKYMQSYVEDAGISTQAGSAKSVKAEQFEKDMFGKKVELPSSFDGKFQGEKIKIISLEDFKNILRNEEQYKAQIKELEKVADAMSTLQPQIKGVSILTQEQAKAVLSGGHINNPEFLKEFFKNRFGKKFMNQYKFVAQNELDSYKQELVDYVKSIIKKAKSTTSGEITSKMLRKASNHNLKMNAINWGAGFITSAMFLSTFIPKLQYQITKWRTGSNEFPGTAQFREEEGVKK
ncbi:hypothetical protein IJ541_05880 [bacterium]|nr:hypothetical protein [bacterium]